jgi:hypothetical protein
MVKTESELNTSIAGAETSCSINSNSCIEQAEFLF